MGIRQIAAVVLAQTFEQAQAVAEALRATYTVEETTPTMDSPGAEVVRPKVLARLS